MKTMKMNRLALAVAGAMAMGVTTVQAAEFTASATVENSLTVTVDQDMSIGNIFATTTGDQAAFADGVAAIIIEPDGSVDSSFAESAGVKVVHLGGATEARATVAVADTFSVTVPDTSSVTTADFEDDTDGTTLTNIIDDAAVTELVHESGNPSVPSLYLMHFTIGDYVGGSLDAGATEPDYAAGTAPDYIVEPGFGSTEVSFGIGATVTTKPTNTAEDYQNGTYEGTFEVTASY